MSGHALNQSFEKSVSDLLTWSHIFQLVLYKCDQVFNMGRWPGPDDEAVARIDVSFFFCRAIKPAQNLVYGPTWEVFRQNLCLLLCIPIRSVVFISQLQLGLSSPDELNTERYHARNNLQGVRPKAKLTGLSFDSAINTWKGLSSEIGRVVILRVEF